MNKSDQIVAMIEYQGRIVVATPTAVFDITDKDNIKVLTTSSAMDRMLTGKTYVLQEVPNDKS